MNEENNNQLDHRDDDEIINRPLEENIYDLTVQLAGLVLNEDNGNSISYEETKDFEESNFPVRKLSITLADKEILKIANFKKDKNGMLDVTIIASFNNSPNSVKNKPFNDGKFKGLLQNGDFNIPLNEVSNDQSLSKSSDNINVRTAVLYLFRENELNCFDNDNINFLLKDVTLHNLLLFVLNKFTSFKFITSKPDHNPQIKTLLIPQTNLLDLFELIDTDMGIYKSDYMLFLNEGVVYFLNKDNDFNCRNTDLEFSVNILVSKSGLMLKPRMVDKLSNENFTVTVGSNEAQVSRNDEQVIRSTINYIFPNGQKFKDMNLITRNVTTVRKITNVKPLEKYKGLKREELVVSINNMASNKWNPLSTLLFVDSSNKRRTFRVSKVYIKVVSRRSVSTKVKGFRLLKGDE